MVNVLQLYAQAAQAQPLLVDCLNSVVLWSLGDAAAQQLEGLKPLRLRRLLSTAAYAFAFIAPFAHYWYIGLDLLVRHFFAPGSAPFIATKVVLDLGIFGVIHVVGFFALLTLAEGGSWQDVAAKVRSDFWPTYTAELLFWGTYQTANFLLVPVLYQVLAVNVATLFDSTFLCWARSRADWAAGLKRWLRVRASGSSGGAEASSKGAEVGGGGAAKWERLASSESVAELELEGGVPQQGAPAAGSQQRVKALAVSDPIPGAS